MTEKLTTQETEQIAAEPQQPDKIVMRQQNHKNAIHELTEQIREMRLEQNKIEDLIKAANNMAQQHIGAIKELEDLKEQANGMG